MTQKNACFTSLRARLLGMTALTGLVAAAGALPATDANAAGFALKEQSGSAQGNSFAGATAGAEDITYMFFNPAGLARHAESQAAVVVSYILPKSDVQTSSATDPANVAVTGTPGEDAGDSAFVPATYLMWALSPDLKLALGINAPFGLKTEYDPGWVGRFHAVESDLKTISINPTVAYRINEQLSIGAGLQIQQVDATLSNVIWVAPFTEALTTVTGDDWGYGGTLGMLYEPSDATRVGLGYRSRIKHTLEGSISNFAFSDSVTADFTSPDQVSLGIYHDINDQWAVMGEVQWTGWNSFDELRVQFNTLPLPDSVTVEDWDNSWFAALGATWKPSDKLTLRGGIAYDQTPIPDATRTPRIPGNDRTWISAGVSYAVTPGISLDAGYTHIFVDNSTVALNQGVAEELNVTYEHSVDILAVQGTFRF